MGEFIYTCYRGLYPPYLIFVVWGIAARIHARRWRPFDWVLLAAFLLFEIFAAFQVRVFYGRWITTARYMLIAVPLYLPFAAEGVIGVWNFVKRDYRTRFVALVAFAVLSAIAVYNFYTPVIKQSSLRGKRTHRLISRRAADWIRKDWRPHSIPDKFQVIMCDYYHSGKRPVVQTNRPVRAVGYMAGGQDYTEFFKRLGIRADYVVTMKKEDGILCLHRLLFSVHMHNMGYIQVGEVEEGEKKAYIYRLTGEDL